MPDFQRIHVIDSHTGGEPTRVVVAGGPDLGEGPLAGARDRSSASGSTSFRSRRRERAARLRRAGRRHCSASRSIRRCVAGVIFFNNVGYLGMCGHGTIGVVRRWLTWAASGRGDHALETPVGV